MVGNRNKVARVARTAVQRRIRNWVRSQPGTQQALCRRLEVSASQLTVLVNEGVERCSLEYLLDVWERCGGTYSLSLGPEEAIRPELAPAGVDHAQPDTELRNGG